MVIDIRSSPGISHIAEPHKPQEGPQACKEDHHHHHHHHHQSINQSKQKKS